MAWEITMIPMYFLIILWGGPGRIAAGIKFVLYSLTGSLLLLVGILGLYLEGGHTFDILKLTEQTYPSNVQFWVFLAFLLAFAIKLPMVPFHSWLPDAHSEAPTAGSVILAGVLLKMGGYGFLRFCLPMLPQASATFAPFILWLSVAAILYGGYLALAQSDLKKLVAYSSISHMGFVTLGIFAFNRQGIQGAVLQMFNHGITTGALFLAVGQLYDRTHSRLIGDYGGLHKPMPRFAAFLCLFSVAAFGLPGAANFIGEFLVLVGTSYRSFVMVLLAIGGHRFGGGLHAVDAATCDFGRGSNAGGYAASRSQLARNRNPCATGYCDSWGGSLSRPAYGNNGRERNPSRAEDERRPAAQGDESPMRILLALWKLTVRWLGSNFPLKKGLQPIRSACLAGESPVSGIGCLPGRDIRHFDEVTHEMKAST